MIQPATIRNGDKPVALITGSGALRIGRCVAQTLAAQGFRLVLHAHRSLDLALRAAGEFNRSGVETIALAADLVDEAAVRQLVAQAVAHFGRIDALVNCAAIWESKPLEIVTAEDVRRHFEVNVLGTFLCCQQVGLQMAGQSQGGAIVTIGDWAIARPYLDYAAYFPSKGAIPTLTRDLAIELAHRNPRIRVNAVLPGPAMLPEDLPLAEREEAIAGTLLKREGSPQDIADAVWFLIRSEFITGVCLPVDGGRSIAP